MNGIPFAMLRHASTSWNESKRLQGMTDIDLSAAGESDASSWRLPPPFDGWKRVSSPLRRARRTAELLRPAAPVSDEPRLREMSFGLWEGHTLAGLRAEGGESFVANERRGLDFQPPGGESPRATMARLANWSAEIAVVGEPVVAVAHKAVLRALLALATGWDMTGQPPMTLDWRRLHVFTAHRDGQVAIERLNVALAAP